MSNGEADETAQSHAESVEAEQVGEHQPLIDDIDSVPAHLYQMEILKGKASKYQHTMVASDRETKATRLDGCSYTAEICYMRQQG